jgi:ribulose-phosphate 3-epimerase
MKISASIYSDSRPLEQTINDLNSHRVDLLHVDCNDEIRVFEDIQKIRELCSIPIDLHIITDEPEKYFQLLRENPVEYVTFQYENLRSKLEIPSDITGKKGLAIITPTDVSVFDEYADFDFILIMATIPGQSGGVFDRINFTKVRSFKHKYPSKSIHVDGGVNAEVSFILRNMGVSSSVSGSFLFKAPSIGHALMELKARKTESHYSVEDFMIPLDESPQVKLSSMTFESVLQTIDDGKMSFCLVLDEKDKLVGICSNADIRKGILKQINNLNSLDIHSMINRNAITIQKNHSVIEMLLLIKKCNFPVMYLPVVDEIGKAVGIVTFVNLIKGEL